MVFAFTKSIRHPLNLAVICALAATNSAFAVNRRFCPDTIQIMQSLIDQADRRATERWKTLQELNFDLSRMPLKDSEIQELIEYGEEMISNAQKKPETKVNIVQIRSGLTKLEQSLHGSNFHQTNDYRGTSMPARRRRR